MCRVNVLNEAIKGAGLHILTPIVITYEHPVKAIAALIATWAVGLPSFKIALVPSLFTSGFCVFHMTKQLKNNPSVLEKRVADLAITTSNTATGAALGACLGIGAPLGGLVSLGGNLAARAIDHWLTKDIRKDDGSKR